MQHTEGRFEGSGSVDIYWQRWQGGRSRAVVVVVHGLGEHSGRYAHVAAALVAAGCSVYALDHRGHGKSGGPRAYIDRFAHAVEDIHQLVGQAGGDHPGKPVFLLGHSMGGALSLSYALKHSESLKALILSGPAVALDGASPVLKTVARLLSAFAPKLGMFAVAPDLVSRDPAVVADYAGDPLVAHGKVPARTLGELIKFLDVLPPMLPLLKLPLLVLHGQEDQLAGVAGSQCVVAGAASSDKTLKVYPHLYHEIFNELPDDRAVVLKDLTDWIKTRIGL